MYQALALGPRHPVMTHFNEKDVLVELDSFLNFCDKKFSHLIPDSAITEINIKTIQYVNQCKKQKVPRHIQLTKLFLKNNDLLAVPFDKGIGFCVMPRVSYENKLKPILDLKQFAKYENKRKNSKDPILKEEERITNTLKSLKADGKISENLYNALKPIGSQPPRLYGLAKVHKDGCPLRPVVSMPGSPYHPIAKKVAEWLSLVPQCNINSNTKDISEDLKNHNVSESEKLVSFDVVSLYTNVPLIESIDVCANLLFDGNIKLNFIDKETFKTLAKLASCDVIFSTHNGYYKQVDGLSMGSSFAPHLANGWLHQFDGRIKGQSTLYSRYMDDVLCIMPNDQIQTKLNEINSFHPALKFTCEIEKDNCISFLDMLIINDNGALSSKWFRKQTDTGLTLNFHSLAPLRYKKSVMIGFVHRIYRSCSSWALVHKGLEEAKVILIKNQYPKELIESTFHETLTKIIKPDNTENVEKEPMSRSDNACLFDVPEKDKYLFFLNYRGKVSEKFAHAVKKLNLPCRVIMTLNKTKHVLTNLKTPIPAMSQSHVVYQVTCPHCNMSYVGQTARHLSKRIREHFSSGGKLKYHFENCTVDPTKEMVKILSFFVSNDFNHHFCKY